MDKKRSELLTKMLIALVTAVIVLGLLIFLSAGSFGYVNGWILIVALFTPMIAFGLILLINSPDVLENRMQSREGEKTQRAVVALSALIFVATFLLAGFNYRFGWPQTHIAVTIFALALLMGGYTMFVNVVRQNAYASRVVAVQENQKVISTGLYGKVRHPMYTATLLIYIAMPLVLGSWFALIPMLFYPVLIVTRIKNEEEMLIKDLPGYREYTQKVKYRLVPGLW